MKLIAKKTNDIKRVIADCYKTDEELIAKYHKLAPTTFAEAVLHTVSSLNSIKHELVIYELFCDDEFSGYYGVQNGKILTGFFILPKFRTKDFILKFWRIVKSKFKGSMFCGLYGHNTRAINFIKKTGFMLYSEQEPNIKWFKFNFS